MSKCEACGWRSEELSRLDHYAIAAMQGILAAGAPLRSGEPGREGETMGMEMLANKAVQQALEVMHCVNWVEALSYATGEPPEDREHER